MNREELDIVNTTIDKIKNVGLNQAVVELDNCRIIIINYNYGLEIISDIMTRNSKKLSKSVSFGMTYGMGAQSLSDKLFGANTNTNEIKSKYSLNAIKQGAPSKKEQSYKYNTFLNEIKQVISKYNGHMVIKVMANGDIIDMLSNKELHNNMLYGYHITGLIAQIKQ